MKKHMKKEKKSISKWIKMQREINTLKLENETLKEAMSSDLCRIFMDKLGESEKVDKLEKTIKSLRKKVKRLKEIIKEDK